MWEQFQENIHELVITEVVLRHRPNGVGLGSDMRASVTYEQCARDS